MKICTKCKEEKLLDVFVKNENTCKSCRKEYNRQWQLKNKDHRKEHLLEYGKQ